MRTLPSQKLRTHRNHNENPLSKYPCLASYARPITMKCRGLVHRPYQWEQTHHAICHLVYPLQQPEAQKDHAAHKGYNNNDRSHHFHRFPHCIIKCTGHQKRALRVVATIVMSSATRAIVLREMSLCNRDVQRSDSISCFRASLIVLEIFLFISFLVACPQIMVLNGPRW